MRLRFLLILGIASIFVLSTTVDAAQKSQNDDVEGSANIDNPDDEDFDGGVCFSSNF